MLAHVTVASGYRAGIGERSSLMLSRSPLIIYGPGSLRIHRYAYYDHEHLQLLCRNPGNAIIQEIFGGAV